jgi:cytochrome d ubiquinol oxidase subunit I
VKLAAAEALFETRAAAPLAIGGIPDVETRSLRYAIHVPYALSILAQGDPHAVVQGLDSVPREDWPLVPWVHVSFQVMVGCGFALVALAAWAAWLSLRKRPLAAERRFLLAAMLASPLGLIALEAGWMVTELGRQPFIIRGVMRTADAVTPMPELWVSLLVSCLIYLLLGAVVAVLLTRYVLGQERGQLDVH